MEKKLPTVGKNPLPTNTKNSTIMLWILQIFDCSMNYKNYWYYLSIDKYSITLFSTYCTILYLL